MKSFYELWLGAVRSAGYPTLSAFLIAHDPKAKPYQTTAREMTGIPGEKRVKDWANLLKLSESQTLELVAAANHDRTIVAKDGRRLGPGIAAIELELKSLRVKEAKVRKQRDEVLTYLIEAGVQLPDRLKRFIGSE